MAYENLCMYCFEDMEGENICPYCGRDSRTAVPQIQMLPGSLVYHDRFLIGRALGQDATGIVYSAYDTKRESKLRLREYLPRDCAERLNDGSVVPVPGLEDQFDAGLKKLRASVESVEDPRKRHFFFEENGTAYIAQRKNTAAAEPEGRSARHRDDDDESGSNLRRILIIAAVAVAVVLIAAVIIISMVSGAVNTPKDVTQLPTLNPDQVWVPAQTPTPTPYVTPTFAALVDPDLSWMDYTYDGDVEEDYKKQEALASTPKPDEDTSGYTTISGKSSSSEIQKFQKQLVTLGWLDHTGVTGKYDAATKQAVKDFQDYINKTFNPDKKLDVDGIAGPKTLQWLDKTQATRPTASPTPVVTPNPEEELTVNENSSSKDIIAVQRKLIFLGVMPEGSDDGVYGASTAAAVRQFQKRVNKLQGYEVLEETGAVDPLTMSFLNYYVEKWENEKPTPEPEATPTPTPAPENSEGEKIDTINKNSAPESIKYLQQMLIAIGMLPEGSADGVYGSATISAVAAFQEWVNGQLKKDVLDVSGEGDQMTLAYLEYCEGNNMYPMGTPTPTDAPTDAPTEMPTQAPTEAPTEAPTNEPTETPTEAPEDEPNEGNIAVGPDSAKESIRFVQSMLNTIGFLGEKDVDGVYGNGTKNAVAAFQQWVNEQRGKNDLEVTGLCDALTLQWMEYCSDNGLIYKDGSDEPADEPTPEPTPEPTEEPADEPETGTLGEISVAIDGEKAGIDVVMVSEGTVHFSWECEGDVDSYYIYVEDATGENVLKGEGVDNTAFEVHSSRITPGQVYTLTVGALPVNGTDEDIVWKQVLFMLPEDESEDEPVYTPEPDPTEEPEAEPEIGFVSEVSINIGGISAGSSPIVMDADSFQITWNGGDEVAAYSYQIKDANDTVIVQKENTDQTGITAKASAMEPGMVYTITVGALPVNGTVENMVWNRAQFVLQQKATEVPTPEPTAEPTEVPGPAQIGKPVIVVDGSAHQQNGVPFMTGDTITISWNAEGDVQSYNVFVENEAGDRKTLGTTTDTSKAIPTDSLPAGLYTIYVGALPVNGGEEDVVWNSYTFGIAAPTPVPTQEPTPEPTPVPTPVPTEVPTPEPTEVPGFPVDVPLDGTADADTILQLQMRLYSFGLLSTDGLEEGILDQKTLQAVVDFQTKVNENFEAGLVIIDPADPNVIIDTDTLWWLFEQVY